MSRAGIEVRGSDGVQTWTMAFPPVNGIGPSSLAALHSCLDEAVEDEAVAAVVLTSGLDVFSAGGDAKWMASTLAEVGPEGLMEKFIGTMEGFRELALRLRRSPLLVIAALNGHTLAGGLELAAACDLRFVADDPKLKLGVPEMELFGQMPSGGGGVQFLSRLIGPARALHFVLDARPVDPHRALEIGLVERVCDPSTLVADGEAFGQRLAAQAGRAGVAAAKRATFTGAELSLADALDLDRSLHWDAVRRGRFAETVQSFVERFA